jgi:hypothetical protein
VDGLVEFLSSPTAQWAIIWTGVVLLVLLLFLRKPRTLVLVSEKTGRLEISAHALNRLLEACCEQLKGVAKARAQVKRSGGKFHARLRLKIRPNAKVDAIQGYLVEEIANIFRDNLGLKDGVGRIDVQVVGVVRADDGFSAA